ncbi:amidase domain-containing protein [Melghirimyces algeriensis]|uniref:Amidase domain-containing protein n=1 Tax=Melghirimyces algeriensis TaxID=910412 RepID=A0A521FAI8_9BACL|nr:amidase domain-containing protein [Melghirimyces algeriensis]SMO93185.1 Putative amidase domain-containing protein [Melghirimyces algeriensis]
MDDRKSKFKKKMKKRKIAVISGVAAALLVGSLAYAEVFPSSTADSAKGQATKQAKVDSTVDEYSEMSDEELVEEVSYYNDISLSEEEITKKHQDIVVKVNQEAKKQNIKPSLKNERYRDFLKQQGTDLHGKTDEQKKKLAELVKLVDQYENKLLNERIRELIKKAKSKGLTKEERAELLNLLPVNNPGSKLKPDPNEKKHNTPEKKHKDKQEPGNKEPDKQEPENKEPDKQEPGEQKPGEEKPGEQEPGKQKPRKPECQEDGWFSGWFQDGQDPCKEEPSEQKPGEQKPGEQKPGEQEPGEQEPSEQEPGEQEPGEQEPDEQEPGEQEPDEQEPGEQEPDEQEPDEQEPDEQEPDEQKPDEQPGTENNGYDRSKARDYAYKWWNKRNNEEYGYYSRAKGGCYACWYDCTNFVSQVIQNGGIKERKGRWDWYDYWYYDDKKPSMTWGLAHSFYKHMKFVRNAQNASTISQLKVGDIVNVDFEGDGNIDHSVVITKIKNGQIYATYHSNDNKDNNITDWLYFYDVYAWKMGTVKNNY